MQQCLLIIAFLLDLSVFLSPNLCPRDRCKTSVRAAARPRIVQRKRSKRENPEDQNLAGPNVWANFPVLEVWIDLEEFRDSPSDVLPGFNERLMNWLPSMIEHRCSEGVRGGFFERLRRGTWLGHILEHTTLELQTLAGNEVGFGRARETSTEGIYRVAIEYKQQEVARAAVDTAFRMLLAAIHDTPFDVDGEIEKLKEVIEDTCLGPSTRSIVDAAKSAASHGDD